MVQVIKEFDATDIVEASIQFHNPDGTKEPGTPFGCVGTLDGEPEVVTITKVCGRRTLKSKSKTQHMNMTIAAHISEQVARDYFGMETEGLKAGVWAAGSMTTGRDFTLTITAIDEFGDQRKLMAFPNASNTAGFRIRPLDTSAEEIAMLELEFSAYSDENGYFYYEAIEAELEDPTVADSWHTDFSADLVNAVPLP